MKIDQSDVYSLVQERVEAERFRALLESCGAYLDGHFVLSSGLHAVKFFNMQRAFQHHLICEIFALHLHRNLPENIRRSATLLVGPERGAWPLLLALAHYLPNINIRTVSLKKRADGGFELPVNAVIEEDDQAILVDDVLTTGKTTNRVIEALGSNPVIGAAYGVNRAPEGWDAGKHLPLVPIVWVFRDPQGQFTKEECPACLSGLELSKI